MPFDYWLWLLALKFGVLPNELEERISVDWLLKAMAFTKLEADASKVHHG